MSPISATTLRVDGVAVRADTAPVRTAKTADPVARRPAGEAAPPRLGPWLLESILAEGAFSQVYRARPADGATGNRAHRYAVKLLRSQWHDEPLPISRIRQESHVGRCVAHRHVVSILSAHVHQPPYYVVMPLVEGRSVAAMIAGQRRLQTPLALWIARQAAEGLEALHTSGYIHGDVTPANLMISTAGHVTLIDLSCARRWDDEPTIESPPLMGTPHFLSPELFAGRYGDPRSDLYSLGLTLFEMLTGQLPIRSNDLATIAAFKRDGAMPSVRLFAPQASNEVAELVRQLTAREPLRRPQRARDVVQALVRLEIASLAEQIPA